MTATDLFPLAIVDEELRVHPRVEIGRPIRAAVLTNPQGGFNRRRDHVARVRSTAATHGVKHVEAASPEDIYRTVREFDADGIELLVANGGDGTLQMVLTALFSEVRSSAPPLLALVAGGTSNTIHREVGVGGPPIAAIDATLNEAERGYLEGAVGQRPVLQVESPLWDRPMCAMQFSAGAIYNAIKFAKREVEGRGAHGPIGPAVGLAWFVFTILAGRSGEVFPPMNLSGSIDGQVLADRTALGVLISTLDRLFLGIRPFWDEGQGSIHFSALDYRPRHLALALGPILRGRRGRFATPENGYFSVNAERIEIEVNSGGMLDGELFDVERAMRFVITAPISASFLQRATR